MKFLSNFPNINSYFSKSKEIDNYPLYLSIEPTNFCNLDCPMCPRYLMTRNVGYMDINLFKKIIDEVEGHVDLIFLHFFGETLFHPHFDKFLTYAGKKGITLSLSTNATLLSPKNIEIIFQSPLDHIFISLDSMRKDIYEKIRKGSDFNKTFSNITFFLEQIKEKKPHINVTLQAIVLPENADEIETIVTSFNNIEGVKVTIKPWHSYANQTEYKEKIIDSTNMCIEPWRGMVISWDGRVFPCCNDYNGECILGDVTKNSVFQVWTSEDYQSFRSHHICGNKSKINICKNCNPPFETETTSKSIFSRFNPSFFEMNNYFNKGLFSPELSNTNWFFWTHKTFEIAVQDKFKNITFTFSNMSPIYKSVSMEIYIYGQKINSIIVDRTTIFSFKTPESLKGRLIRFTFVLERTWCPKQTGLSEDNRNLGIVLRDITNQ